jgi:hypothetical protein
MLTPGKIWPFKIYLTTTWIAAIFEYTDLGFLSINLDGFFTEDKSYPKNFPRTFQKFKSLQNLPRVFNLQFLNGFMFTEPSFYIMTFCFGKDSYPFQFYLGCVFSTHSKNLTLSLIKGALYSKKFNDVQWSEDFEKSFFFMEMPLFQSVTENLKF